MPSEKRGAFTVDFRVGQGLPFRRKMVLGMSRCNECGLIFSFEEKSTHKCKKHDSLKIDRVEYIHCLFQELENLNIRLPMGDYMLIYDILEDIRNDLELSELMWQTFMEDKGA